MKLLSSLEFQIIAIVVASILLLFQSSEAISSSESHKDAKDGKNTVFCDFLSGLCLTPVGYTLRIDLEDPKISENSCASNISQLNLDFTRNGKTLRISTGLNNGTNGFRFECNGVKHWLIKDSVTLSDSGTYSGFAIVQNKHDIIVQVVDELQCHSSDDGTHVLIAMNYLDFATTNTTITNSSCRYNQTNSVQQFTTTELYWKAFIFNLKGKAFDPPQLCCQLSVWNADVKVRKTFFVIPETTLQIGQCNQTTVTITPEPSVTPTPPGHSSSSIVSSSEKIKSSTFPVVVLLFVAFSFHQRYLINYRP